MKQFFLDSVLLAGYACLRPSYYGFRLVVRFGRILVVRCRRRKFRRRSDIESSLETAFASHRTVGPSGNGFLTGSFEYACGRLISNFFSNLSEQPFIVFKDKALRESAQQQLERFANENLVFDSLC